MVGLIRTKVFLQGARARGEDAVDAPCHGEGVQGILASMEGFDVVILAEDETSLEVRIELACRIVRADRAVLDIHSSRDFPRLAPHPPTGLGARLLAGLLTDARRSFRSIARGTRTLPG